MKILCTICARAGSKGVANKNLRLINGLPLIAYSLQHAVETKLFSQIAVSSDSSEIRTTAMAHGATFVVDRPTQMASDTAPKLPAIRHCVETTEKEFGQFDIIIDLDATAPLRIAADIIGSLELLTATNADNVITGTPAHRSPYFNLVEQDENGIVQLSKPLKDAVTRRQDSPKCFDMNASIYVWRRDALLNNSSLFVSSTRLFEMPRERSLDIDSEADFEMVEWMMSKGSAK
jgi:N-acylneuraminate cytidylyltransferase/CMP-N,N'-diacetyllegionaminic acid synthase